MQSLTFLKKLISDVWTLVKSFFCMVHLFKIFPKISPNHFINFFCLVDQWRFKNNIFLVSFSLKFRKFQKFKTFPRIPTSLTLKIFFLTKYVLPVHVCNKGLYNLSKIFVVFCNYFLNVDDFKQILFYKSLWSFVKNIFPRCSNGR